ncbi:MAG: DUF951 family protein [Clostridia bacterium]|nr:DUF951 family protein [Clostridia bacterium]
MEIKKFNVGDVLEMKKTHPCGEKRMKVLHPAYIFQSSTRF